MAVWWDSGLASGHTYVALEWGAWAGGRGPRIVGCAAFIGDADASPVRWPVDAYLKDHAPAEWRGLALVALRAVDGELLPVGTILGWPPVVHDMWLRNSPRPVVGPRDATHSAAVVGIPVSLPPWPHYPTMANKQAQVVGVPLGPGMPVAHYALHDIDVRDGTLYCGGSDGYVGVALGEGWTMARAVREALVVAGTFARVPEAQWRTDAGDVATRVLVELDVAGMLSA